jgi:hypothetical protein
MIIVFPLVGRLRLRTFPLRMFNVSAAHFIEQLLNPLFHHGRHSFVNNFLIGLVSSHRARVDRLTEA